ncbi:MAG: cell division protein FtsZ [Ruminococcaceae bacterium]|nr:cell division protein FtsZ [Oscillospiraceae bacterium]
MPFGFEEEEGIVQIKVAGVGGGGNNAINRMVSMGVKGVDFIAVNTDKAALIHSTAPQKIQIGEKLTKGQGAGARPDVGQRAAEENYEEIAAAMNGADMVFIAAGMGGGTGTGAAPVIAQIAKEMGILTIGVVTKPFNFEGKRRMQQAEIGIDELRKHVDSLVVIPNERLKLVAEHGITLQNAFQAADDVLRQGIQSITDLIKTPGLVSLDFADVSAIMRDAGLAHMGTGHATGRDKAEIAAKMAISSPLLETTINGAHGVIINITSSPDIGLDEIELASEIVSKEAHVDANIIWGTAFDDTLEDEIRVTVIATGFEAVKEKEFYSTVASKTSQQAAAEPAKPRFVAPEAKHAAEEPAAEPAKAPVTEKMDDDSDPFGDFISLINKRGK